MPEPDDDLTRDETRTSDSDDRDRDTDADDRDRDADDRDSGDEVTPGEYGSAEGGSGFVPQTAPGTSGADFATQVALMATAQGVENALTSSAVLAALGDIADLDAAIIGTLSRDALEGETADALAANSRTMGLIVEVIARDAFAALSTIGDRIVPALAGVAHSQPAASPTAALAATPTGVALDSTTIAMYFADALHIFESLWAEGLDGKSTRSDGPAPTSTSSAEAGVGEDDPAADFADEIASALTTPTAAVAPGGAPMGMPLGTHLSSAMPMMQQAPMMSPAFMGAALPPMSGMGMPAMPGMGPMPMPSPGIPPTPYGSRGTGITAGDIRQMVADAKNRVQSELRARGGDSRSPVERPTSTTSTDRSVTPRTTVPTADPPSSGRDASPVGRGGVDGPTSGRTIGGVAGIDPAQVQGRPGSGAATGLSAAPTSTGGSGGGNHGMRGGMMPMGAMGAMGAMGGAGGAGAAKNATDRDLTTSDPTLTGTWATSIGVGGAVITLGGEASAAVDLGENLNLAPKAAPTAGGARW